MKKCYLQKTFILCSLIFLISIVITIFKYNILPAKYFYDSNKIVDIMMGIGESDSGFDFAANFYKCIDIFRIHELELVINGKIVVVSAMLQWGLILSFVGTTLVFFLLIKRRNYTLLEYMFLYASMVLLNIYVFNISKDFIQFLFILLLYIILISNKFTNIIKIFLMGLVLSYVAFNFRIYYGIMALFIVNLYGIYMLFFKNRCLNIKNLIIFVLLSFLVFFVEVFLIGIISSSSYDEIMYARSSVNDLREGSMDAATMITEPFGDNTNIFIFSINYIVDFIRMMFPLELLLKNVKYVVFVIYQLFITYNLIRLWKRMQGNNKQVLLFIVIFSFEMMSVIFEPDFGSFVKHQSAMTLLFLEMVISNKFGNSNRGDLE